MDKSQRESLLLSKNIRIPTNYVSFKEDFIDRLEEIIPAIYIDASVKQFFEQLLLGKCGSISIEYPYYDADFLSIYYAYYTKSFRQYKKECCRIVLYGMDDTCVGYVTLRPLPRMKKIGKTYLDPTVFAQNNAYIICGQHKMHFQGKEATIEAMPYMQQEKSIAVCSHICLWSTIRFFSSRFPNRSNQTIGDIVERIHSPSERKVPSRGLTPTQISTLLIDSGFSSIILRRDSSIVGEAPLIEQLCAYIDSGLPVICVSSSLAHAVVACGRTQVSAETAKNVAAKAAYLGARVPEVYQNLTNAIPLVFEASMIESVIVNDDNELPYNNVSVLDITETNPNKLLQLSQIDVCIVPLDSQMQLPYSDAKYTMELLFYQEDEDHRYMYKWQDNIGETTSSKNAIHFSKISLVSSNTFKEWIRENIDTGCLTEEFNVLLLMSYPKFLWLGEFASLDEYCKGECSGFILLDPTCASTDTTACLILADNKCCRIRKHSNESESESIYAFEYASKFSIPFFRKNYVEVRENGQEEN